MSPPLSPFYFVFETNVCTYIKIQEMSSLALQWNHFSSIYIYSVTKILRKIRVITFTENHVVVAYHLCNRTNLFVIRKEQWYRQAL